MLYHSFLLFFLQTAMGSHFLITRSWPSSLKWLFIVSGQAHSLKCQSLTYSVLYIWDRVKKSYCAVTSQNLICDPTQQIDYCILFYFSCASGNSSLDNMVWNFLRFYENIFKSGDFSKGSSLNFQHLHAHQGSLCFTLNFLFFK